MLLSYVDGLEPDPVNALAPLDMIDAFLEEWCLIFGGNTLPSPTLKERTFWFTLYQYEELVEMTDSSPLVAPYKKLLEKNLDTVKELQRKDRHLPQQFFATRPGKDDVDDDE